MPWRWSKSEPFTAKNNQARRALAATEYSVPAPSPCALSAYPGRQVLATDRGFMKSLGLDGWDAKTQ